MPASRLRRPSPILAALFCASLAATVLAPVVTADHAFSHRFIVLGRVVDAAGNPLPGTSVQVGLDPGLREKQEGVCARQPGTETEAWGETTTRPQTNEFGEYIYCFHMHSIARGTKANVHVSALGEETRVPADVIHRVTFANLVVSEGNGTASAEFNRTYTVAGRVMFREAKTTVEGQTVFGDTLHHLPVTVTWKPADGGAEVTKTATTNNYGDFAIRLDVGDSSVPAKVTVSAAEKTMTVDADPTTRMSVLQVEVKDPDAAKKALSKFGPLVVLVGLVGAGAYFLFRGGKGAGAKKGKR